MYELQVKMHPKIPFYWFKHRMSASPVLETVTLNDQSDLTWIYIAFIPVDIFK